MIVNFIVTIFMTIIMFNIWSFFNKQKINYKNYKTILLLIFNSLATLINYFSVNQFFKVITITLIFSIIYKLLFKTKLKESIIGPIVSQFIFFISECIVSIIMLKILNNDVKEFVNNYFGSLVMNLSISLLSFFMSRIKIFTLIFLKMNSIVSKIDDEKCIFISFLGLFFYNLFGINAFYGLNPQLLLIICFFISVLAFILVYMFFKTKDDYYKMNDKYNSSLLSLKELEKAITNHRIDNHENKNHLMTIRNMTKNKKVISFIDSILNNKVEDDKIIMKETSVIPAGGLRGLVYSKLLLMKSKNIDYELDISNSVRIVDIFDFDDDLMLDVCKIIGIFLDNAIEEVETIEDKYIVIEMYLDDSKLYISVSNTFDNTKDKSNIYKAGVSSKGGNHGYGLSLAKKLIKNNDRLGLKNEITENEFTQILIIK